MLRRVASNGRAYSKIRCAKAVGHCATATEEAIWTSSPVTPRNRKAFRKEVADWLVDNVPDDLEFPPDSADLSREQWLKRRDIGMRLGSRGWLWPTMPPEYGGGGLDVDHAVILEEELDTHGLSIPPLLRLWRKDGRPHYPDLGHGRAKNSVFCLLSSLGRSQAGSCLPNPTLDRTLRVSRPPPLETATTTC